MLILNFCHFAIRLPSQPLLATTLDFTTLSHRLFCMGPHFFYNLAVFQYTKRLKEYLGYITNQW